MHLYWGINENHIAANLLNYFQYVCVYTTATAAATNIKGKNRFRSSINAALGPIHIARKRIFSLMFFVHYWPQQWLRKGNVFPSVYLSTGEGMHTPPRLPMRRTVRIPLECILVLWWFLLAVLSFSLLLSLSLGVDRPLINVTLRFIYVRAKANFLFDLCRCSM